MLRAELQQLCGENKHRLPPDFDCRWSTPILEAALHKIGALPSLEPSIDFISDRVKHPHIIINQILHKLNIVLIRRLSILNHGIYQGTLNEYFWRKHVQSTMKLRHIDKVIEEISIGGKNRWRSYALMREPRIAREVYLTRGPDNSLEKIADSVSIKQFEIYLGDTFILEGNDRLTWQTSLEKERLMWVEKFPKEPFPEVETKFMDINNVNKFYNYLYKEEFLLKSYDRVLLGIILNNGQFELHKIPGLHKFQKIEKPLIYQLRYNDKIVEASIDELIALITIKGEVVLTDLNFSYRHLIETKVGALKVLISKLSSANKVYVLHVIGIDGSLMRYRIEIDRFNVITTSTQRQYSSIPKIVDLKVFYDPYTTESIMVLSDKGEVYVMGRNIGSMLGIPGSGYIKEFTKLPISNTMRIDISDSSSAIVKTDGKVLLSGSLKGWMGMFLTEISERALDVVCKSKSIYLFRE